MKPTEQIYSNYTHEDFAVWKLLFDRQMVFLNSHASDIYLEALKKVQFTNTKIPDFQQVNKLLEDITGWNLTVVPNICPQAEFFDFLSRKKFTATCWVRSLAQLEYLEEPDMFHDVFGHVPLLSNEAYSTFLLKLSQLAKQHIHNDDAIEILGRLYWYTIEFGLIEENNELKIYGAGLISSIGEAKHALGEETIKHDFDIEKMMLKPYRNDIMQHEYFVIHDYTQLYNAIPKIEIQLQDILRLQSVNNTYLNNKLA